MNGGSAGLRLAEPQSILVVKPSSFGDIIHTLSAVVRLRSAWPQARLSWVVNEEWAPLLAGNPCVDELVIFPRSKFRGLGGFTKFFAWCREEISGRKPDLAVDYQGLLRSAWITRASGAKRSVGMRDAREGARWFYDELAVMPTGRCHAVERYLATTRHVLSGIGDGEGLTSTGEAVFPLPEGVPLANGTPNIPERFMLLHPFARGRGKSLSAEQISEICQHLAPVPVVLVGRNQDGLVGHLPDYVLNLLNLTTLAQLIHLTRRAAVVITVDSGPSHLAAALDRPMIAIHTWSDPRLVGPYRKDAWVWKNGRLIQFGSLGEMDEQFYRQPSPGLRSKDLATIAALATSL